MNGSQSMALAPRNPIPGVQGTVGRSRVLHRLARVTAFAGLLVCAAWGSANAAGFVVGVGSSSVPIGALALSGSTVEVDGTLDLSLTKTASTIGSLSGASTGVIDLNNAGTPGLIIDSASTSYAGTMNGTSAVVDITGGTQGFTGNNSYSGSTIVGSGATLALSGAAALPNSSVQADGTLDISGMGSAGVLSITSLSGSGQVALGAAELALSASSGTYSGTISGTGNLSLYPGGKLTLSGQSPFSGRVNIYPSSTLYLSGTASLGQALIGDAGILDISQTSAGASVGALEGNGNVTLGSQTLTINNGDSQWLMGTISGTGGLHIAGGNEMLALPQAYLGLTTIDSGATLSLVGTGTVLGPIVNNGSLVFVTASDTYASSIQGTGTVEVQSGTATLSAPSMYTGATTIDAGATLDLTGSGSLGNSALADNGTLNISGSTAGATVGSLSGSGSVQLGASTLSLADAAGTMSGIISGSGGLSLLAGQEILASAQGYQGITTIQGGILGLAAGASLSSPVLVQSAGTLSSDSATIAGAVDNLGTVTVGSASSPGAVLSVQGNYTQGAAGVLQLSLSPGANSRLVVTGSSLGLNGTLRVVATPGNYQKAQYILVQAPSTTTLTGTFSQLQVQGLGSLYGYSLSYLSDPQVLLSLYPVDTFSTGAYTPNTRGPAVALSGAVGNATGPLYDRLATLNGLPTRQLSMALDQMDGQMYAETPGWMLQGVSWAWEQVFARMNLSQQIDPHGVHSVFLIGDARASHLLGDGNADSTREGEQGFMLGDQGHRGPWHMGALVGAMHLGALRSGALDSLSASLWHGGAFAYRDLDDVRLGGVLGYTQGPVNTIGASREAYLLTWQTRAGRTFHMPRRNLSLTPLLGLNLQYMVLQSVTETDTQLGLNVPSQCQSSGFALAELRLDKRWKHWGVQWTVSAGVGVRHWLKPPVDHVSLQFNGIPGSVFTTYGVAPDRNVYQGSVGVRGHINKHLYLGATYEGRIGQSTRSNAFTLRAVWHF